MRRCRGSRRRNAILSSRTSNALWPQKFVWMCTHHRGAHSAHLIVFLSDQINCVVDCVTHTITQSMACAVCADTPIVFIRLSFVIDWTAQPELRVSLGRIYEISEWIKWLIFVTANEPLQGIFTCESQWLIDAKIKKKKYLVSFRRTRCFGRRYQ